VPQYNSILRYQSLLVCYLKGIDYHNITNDVGVNISYYGGRCSNITHRASVKGVVVLLYTIGVYIFGIV